MATMSVTCSINSWIFDGSSYLEGNPLGTDYEDAVEESLVARH